MESRRQQKFAKLIKQELSEIFQKEANHWLNGAFITITTVRITPDLSLARVYLSLMMVDKIDEFFYKLEDNKGSIKKALGNRIRNQVRKIPDLAFFHDDTQAHVSKINDLLSNLDIPEKKNDDEENQ